MQLIEYLNQNNILPLKQSGFRAGLSTVTGLLSVVDDILTAQDTGESTILILLDFSRAFDTIDTTLLLSKLMYYGFDCNALKWFESYLNGRTQRVRLQNETGTNIFSVASPVTRSVPQGSILGPLLFILYSADITGCFKYCQYRLYADDLQVYISFNKLNQDLSVIAEWANNNELILNSNKIKLMILGSKKLIERTNAHKPKIVVGGNYFEQVSEVRNLGIIMDSSLRFENHSKLIYDKHISSIITRAYKAMGFVIRCSCAFNSLKTIKILYCSFVRPILEYASQVWNPQYEVYKSRIEGIQKRFLKYLDYRAHTDSQNYEERCKRYHFLPLSVRRNINDVCFYLKICNGSIYSPELLSDVTLNVPLANKRKRKLLYINRAHTNYRRNSFMIRTAKFINSLNFDIDPFYTTPSVAKSTLTSEYFA
ncbi:unnamed protein product [Parnassius mnemosyne]|uniref:Reverse transcriptase domain-containing protein n=1 Tax=Parnassius mnemosyne TaxID=213953 RepID=A0AAV1LLS7_9NEOP